MARKLIVGLGNPGPEYAATRHNVGWRCVETLAERQGWRFGRSRHQAEVAAGALAGRPVVLARPRTYMNESGRAVAPLVRFYQVELADLLVIYDELDLPFGQLRLRGAGSAAGHNGMRSVIEHLGTPAVARLRIGIGRPPGRMPGEKYVLTPFSAAERELLPLILDAAADAVATWVGEGLDVAMNRFNGWMPPGTA